MQRCRYLDAQMVHRMLSDFEQRWMGQCSEHAKVAHVRNACNKRTRIIVSKPLSLFSM
jgi:hypothetical protein